MLHKCSTHVPHMFHKCSTDVPQMFHRISSFGFRVSQKSRNGRSMFLEVTCHTGLCNMLPEWRVTHSTITCDTSLRNNKKHALSCGVLHTECQCTTRRATPTVFAPTPCVARQSRNMLRSFPEWRVTQDCAMRDTSLEKHAAFISWVMCITSHNHVWHVTRDACFVHFLSDVLRTVHAPLTFAPSRMDIKLTISMNIAQFPSPFASFAVYPWCASLYRDCDCKPWRYCACCASKSLHITEP